MNELSVLIVEDEPSVCQSFLNLAESIEDIYIVSVTNNASKAVSDIKDFLPNAVILDLELHQGGGSGLDVLQELQELSLDTVPYILVTTNNTSSITYEYARQLGADFIMSKHQENYSEKTALDFLKMMKNVIHNKRKTSPLIQLTTEAPKQQNKRITRRIISELNNIGINPKSVGYQYLIDAIFIVIQKPTQNLCTVIGQKYKKTESSVERAMQNAICRAWRQTDIEDLLRYYTAKVHSEKGVPTVTEFIYYYANKIKNEY